MFEVTVSGEAKRYPSAETTEDFNRYKIGCEVPGAEDGKARIKSFRDLAKRAGAWLRSKANATFDDPELLWLATVYKLLPERTGDAFLDSVHGDVLEASTLAVSPAAGPAAIAAAGDGCDAQTDVPPVTRKRATGRRECCDELVISTLTRIHRYDDLSVDRELRLAHQAGSPIKQIVDESSLSQGAISKFWKPHRRGVFGSYKGYCKACRDGTLFSKLKTARDEWASRHRFPDDADIESGSRRVTVPGKRLKGGCSSSD